MKFVKTQQWFIRILTVILVILPFVYWPGSSIPFEIPRVFFVKHAIELLALLGIFVLAHKKISPTNRGLLYIIIGFVLFATFSALFGVDFTKSVQGNYYRDDGLLTFWRLGGFCLLIGFLWNHKFSSLLSFGIISGSFLVSLATVVSALLYLLGITFFPPWQGAFGLTFGQPNFLAGYLTISLPFFFYGYFHFPKKYRTLLFLAAGIQFLALILTQAWGAWLSLAITGSVMFLFEYPLSKTIKRGIIVGLFILFVASTGFLWIKKNELPQSTNAESRQRIFTKLLLAYPKHPLLGWGWANIDHAFNSVDWPYKFQADVYVDKAHSTFLEVLVTTGGLGFLLYVSILASSLWYLRRGYLGKKSDTFWFKTLFFALITFIIHSQTNVIGIAEEFIFWLIIGISLQKNTKSSVN